MLAAPFAVPLIAVWSRLRGALAGPAFAGVACAFYLALSLAKMHAYLAEGRFWAEEGTVFYARLAGLPFLQGLAHLFNGHLELATNLVVALSTLVPFQYAPFVTTWLAFLLQSIPVALLIAYRDRIGLPRWGVLGLLLILVGLPQAAEVWANAANLHFHFALLAAVIAALDPGPPRRRVLFRGLLAFAGLSGIPANFLAPLFLVQAALRKDRERWVQFGILVATSLLQLWLLAGGGFAAGERSLQMNPLLLWLSVVSQQILSPLFGLASGERLAALLREVLVGNAVAWGVALLCSLPAVAFVRAAVVSWPHPSSVLGLSALVLSLLSILTSLGDKTALVSAAGGGRYFFVSNVLVALVLCIQAAPRRALWARVFFGVLIVSSAFRVGHYLPGPSWRSAYDQAAANGSPRVDIWPPGWTMPNFATR